MAENDKRDAARVPAAMRIRLRYTDVDTFVDRYATNVSKGGIFIATRTPKPIGALVRFEFQLADGSPVVKGEGKVAWVKEYDPDHPQRPHGMGLKFTRLDTASKALLDRMLAHKQEMTAPGASGPHEGSGMRPLPAEASQGRASSSTEGSGMRPLPVEASQGRASSSTEGSGVRPLPHDGSGPVIVEGSGVRPLPHEGSGPVIAEGSGVRPLPHEGSGPVLPEASQGPASSSIEGSGVGPLPQAAAPAAAPPSPTAEPAPPPAAAPPAPAAPRPRGPAPRPAGPPPTVPAPRTVPDDVARLPAVRDLEALAVELGFTGDMLALALARAHELAHLADAEPALAGLWSEPTEPGTEGGPVPPGGRRLGGEESTDVDHLLGERRAQPGFSLADPLHAGPLPEAAPAAERGGLMSSVKKLFGK